MASSKPLLLVDQVREAALDLHDFRSAEGLGQTLNSSAAAKTIASCDPCNRINAIGVLAHLHDLVAIQNGS